MDVSKMTEIEIRKMYSGFIPPKLRAQLDANREPSEAEIAAAKALLAKVHKTK